MEHCTPVQLQATRKVSARPGMSFFKLQAIVWSPLQPFCRPGEPVPGSKNKVQGLPGLPLHLAQALAVTRALHGFLTRFCLEACDHGLSISPACRPTSCFHLFFKLHTHSSLAAACVPYDCLSSRFHLHPNPRPCDGRPSSLSQHIYLGSVFATVHRPLRKVFLASSRGR